MVDNEKLGSQQLENLKNKGHDLERRVLQKDMCGLYTNKLDNLDEVDKFLETHNLPRWKHEQIENLSRLLISKEVESVTTSKIFQQRKAQITSLMNSTKHLKKN